MESVERRRLGAWTMQILAPTLNFGAPCTSTLANGVPTIEVDDGEIPLSSEEVGVGAHEEKQLCHHLPQPRVAPPFALSVGGFHMSGRLLRPQATWRSNFIISMHTNIAFYHCLESNSTSAGNLQSRRQLNGNK